MIPIEDALAIVLGRAKALGSEEVDFEASLGRLLREDVTSDIDMPPFARSAVDGFALRADDVDRVPARLSIVGEVPAGQFPDFEIAAGEAAGIMTGAPVPEGADAVQMVERSRTDGQEVEILETIRSGQNVAPRGSEVRVGDTVLRAGTRIDPPAVAVAATVGKTTLTVGRRPAVAVVATGDELVHPSEKPSRGQIRNSNGFSLMAQSKAAGALSSYLGVAKDDPASLETLIRDGLTNDVLLLSGGVSMGVYDLVEDVLEAHGVELLVDAVALKPGKPLVFGIDSKGTLVFGLPGNPVSTMVTFELFVRPALARLEGASSPTRTLLSATLLSALASKGPRRAYLPGWIVADDSGALLAYPIKTQGSADIVAFSKANALLIVPEDRTRLDAGENVGVYPLDSFLFKEDRWRIARPS